MSAKDKIFWTEFLELYKSMPSLWKIKSPEYSNRKLKTKCYDIMVKKLKEIDPHASRDRVIKKINVFRTNYKRDLKRQKISEKYGDDDEFRSSLWYFDKLKFLEDQQCGEEEQCAKDAENINSNIFKKADETIKPTSLSKKRKKSVEDNLLEIACQKLINTDESSSILSKGWAMQYKELSKEQQVFTRIIIADVLFHGCLNKMTEKTVEDIHKVLKEHSVPNLQQSSDDYDEEYENLTSSPNFKEHVRSPSLEKTETFF